MLIGIAGKPGSGKDTLADYIRAVYGNAKFHAAQPFKYALSRMFFWDENLWENREWKDTVQPDLGFSPRQAAQTLMTEWVEVLDPGNNLPFVMMEKKLKHHKIKIHETVIPCIRYPANQDWVHRHEGVVIYVHRHEAEKGYHLHKAENSIDMSKVDAIIRNDGSINDMQMEFNSVAEKKGWKL